MHSPLSSLLSLLPSDVLHCSNSLVCLLACAVLCWKGAHVGSAWHKLLPSCCVPPFFLAGGKVGYDKVEWSMGAVESDKGQAVRFSYSSWDGEEVRRHPAVHAASYTISPLVLLQAWHSLHRGPACCSTCLLACLPACRASPATSSCRSPTLSHPPMN
jgi:hypothetical protein